MTGTRNEHLHNKIFDNALIDLPNTTTGVEISDI